MAKKTFLILVENLGKTAPGIVFERLFGELSRRYDVDLVCLNNKAESSGDQVYCRQTINHRLLHALSPATKARLSKFSLGVFGDDWGARLNATALLEIFYSRELSSRHYDYIFSFISYRHTSPLLAAEKLIKDRIAGKNIAYFVDAIPAPLGWSRNNLEFRGLKKFIVRRMKRLDIIFSSNAKMLKYQLSLAAGVVDVPAHVLFNPIAGDQKNYPPPSGNDYKFLYTGSVYGGRTVKHVFEALKIALRKEKNLYLVFVGTNISDTDMAALNEVERKHVLIEPFSENLDRFYQESIALLDIDADISNDVFLSSKVTNYLAVNRIIISETGHNSPASDLFSGLTSIIQCPHDSSKIAEAMIFAVENAKYMRFDDRLDLLKAFSVRSVVDRIQDVISLEME